MLVNWALLRNSFSQTVGFLAVFGDIDGLVLREQFIVNHSLDIPPDARYLLQVESSLETLLDFFLRFPGSLALHVIVDDALFVPGDHLLKKRYFLFFSSSKSYTSKRYCKFLSLSSCDTHTSALLT